MKRTQIYIDEESDRQLASRAEATGTTKSALIRDAIAAYLRRPDDDQRRLARFRSAVRAAAEVGADLPSGAEYVEGLRRSDRDRDAEIDDRRRA